MNRIILVFLFLVSTPVWGLSGSGFDALRSIPVQDGGRIKPFETFAVESLQLVYGKSKIEGKPAVEVVMTWFLAPEEWANRKIFLIRHSGLREGLRLDNKRMYYSLNELIETKGLFGKEGSNEGKTVDSLLRVDEESEEDRKKRDTVQGRIGLTHKALQAKRAKEEKLDSYFQAAQKLLSQITRFIEIGLGRQLLFFPSKPGAYSGEEGQKWTSLKDIGESESVALRPVFAGFSKELNLKKSDSGLGLASAVNDFMSFMKNKYGPDYAPFSQLKAELHYNEVEPFKWSWIFYLLSVFLCLLMLAFNHKKIGLAIWVSMILGFLMHTYGIGLRVFISDRPPVSNMFETVIWVPWIAVLSAFFIEKKYKNWVIFLGSALVAVICLILCYLAPTILDASFSPLEPVLKDNFWLLTHVIIIVSSYGPYFLAFLLGDVCMFYFLSGEQKHKRKIKELTQIMYRCMQLGSILLLAGTILGGVWADYSWGRFWGWDPKETWALIAFLGYIAVLHARLVGWVKDFGMAASSVVTFSLVIMAWYGVNYVLGAGLHSYGFGAGGLEYVTTFVGAHFLFVGYVAVMRKV